MESNRQGRGGEHRGQVRDPENDGRLKENRETVQTKGATSRSEALAREQGREPDRDDGRHRAGAGHGRSASQSHSQGSHGDRRDDDRGGRGENDRREREDLKSREYRDEQGEVHHHTRTYMEQHGKK